LRQNPENGKGAAIINFNRWLHIFYVKDLDGV
jgi:hypothetical protein